MDTTLRKEIMSFLTPLTCMQSEESRRAALLAAGLDVILTQTDLSGSPTNAVSAIVYALEHYGTVDDIPALVVFLRYVATTVGGDKQKLIQRFCERLLQNDTGKQPSSQQTVADTSTTTHISTQGDYFEHVEGEATVNTGNVQKSE